MSVTRHLINANLDYTMPVKVAEDVYWVGFFDEISKLHCNPYLIIDGDEAVLLDSGSRPDFAVVMMKILDSGIFPEQIKCLIYQHYDPDLCGSLPHFERIINDDRLRIISHTKNIPFINHYSVGRKLECIEELGGKYVMSSGRTLRFFRTPFSHAPGSFVTLDEKTGTLFTSDLFGSYTRDWNLFIELEDDCDRCQDYENCPHGKTSCPLLEIKRFHKDVMTSERALRYAMEVVEGINPSVIAPQHGSVIYRKQDIELCTRVLKELEGVGFDAFLEREKVE